ncbi:hypothetical protein SCALIN_C45_0026 [Candidatus Scalindua japonica]|uniref:Uncharacterized protein n=1 Tax=Candidatus Scalindua japonica TaxID=1284222 RepID=A0A286U3Y3_9BACT|nr:hypothetical protein SCALIN_C45_0026 [Candidatus Scalindua japonica]
MFTDNVIKIIWKFFIFYDIFDYIQWRWYSAIRGFRFYFENDKLDRSKSDCQIIRQVRMFPLKYSVTN